MIGIVTDSSCDLPAPMVDELGVSIVPLTIRFGDTEYVDRVDLDQAGFWREMARSSRLPETAAPSAGAFSEAFGRLQQEGADGILAVCLSSTLSATYQSAVIAAEQMELPIRVVDSQNVSMALGLQVIAAARVAAEGGDLATVAAAAAAAVRTTNLFAALDTLDYLKRGGRVGGAQAFVGTLIDVKPLITIEHGAVAATGRVRTRSKARQAIIARAAELEPRIEDLCVLHGGAADVETFADQIRRAVPGREPILAQLGPVVGTHSGPGTLGIAYRLR